MLFQVLVPIYFLLKAVVISKVALRHCYSHESMLRHRYGYAARNGSSSYGGSQGSQELIGT
jgi:hypothetical protein